MTMHGGIEEDEDTIEIIRAYEAGELKPLAGKALAEELARAKQAADHFIAKRERMNIRISSWDKMMLQRKAAEQGLGYQTLAASILHMYVTGQLRALA